MQALGKMVVERVSKGRCCEIPLGGHQVKSLLLILSVLIP